MQESIDQASMKVLKDAAGNHPYPLLFATISGAHLYGFPSPDSDFDLRGVHVLPPAELLGLMPARETVEQSGLAEGIELDLVSHDLAKFFKLLLKKNGYVLEQLYSPLIVQTSPEHEQLKLIARSCITKHHQHHYQGFAANQWKILLKEKKPRLKTLLYVYRVLLTGIHLMRHGVVEANLAILNQDFRLPYIDELIGRKSSGAEKDCLLEKELDFHATQYNLLKKDLHQAAENSFLPENPGGKEALHELLLQIRFGFAEVQTPLFKQP